jgi:hypothetical protein
MVASWGLEPPSNEGLFAVNKRTVRVGARGQTIRLITMNRVLIRLKSSHSIRSVRN